MKSRYGQKIFSGLLVWLSVAAPATISLAEDTNDAAKDWGLNTSFGTYTDYMFRGKNVYEGISLQPSATGFYDFGDAGSLSLNVWAHIPGESNEPPEKFNEVDTTVAYEIDVDMVTLSAGHIFYTFPGGEGRIRDTLEYFASVQIDTIANPTFTFYHDYDEGKYQYYTLGFSQPVPLDFVGDDVVVTPYVTFGFASNSDDQPRFYFNDGLVHTDFGISTDLKMGKIIVTPNFNVTLESDDGATNEFWAGIDFSLDF
jgi:hypothetical protein